MKMNAERLDPFERSEPRVFRAAAHDASKTVTTRIPGVEDSTITVLPGQEAFGRLFDVADPAFGDPLMSYGQFFDPLGPVCKMAGVLGFAASAGRESRNTFRNGGDLETAARIAGHDAHYAALQPDRGSAHAGRDRARPHLTPRGVCLPCGWLSSTRVEGRFAGKVGWFLWRVLDQGR